MKYLAIDTSGDLLVLLENNGETLVKRLIGSQTKHSLTLMPFIEEILEEAKITLDELDFFAVVTGPGSFTGIRIGVATIKALCLATGKNALQVTSFDLLAYTDNAPQNCLCLIDANHDNYYCAGYKEKVVTIAPCFLTAEQVKGYAREYQICSSVTLPFENLFVCDLVGGMKNAIKAKIDNIGGYNEIEPLYVKRSQAEEESC